ncbi:MAG: hypothetical protein AB7T31_15640 [Gemmatimonadales bacterium]
MDQSVAIVETYLRLNGYFTVTEFPVVERPENAKYRTATDLDILAVRFPEARRSVPGEGREPAHPPFSLDPALGVHTDEIDMIVGEVKESSAEFNSAGLRLDVLGAALARFGCCPADAASPLVERLVREGRTKTHSGHLLRMVAFGGKVSGPASYLQIPLGHVLDFVLVHVREHWEVMSRVQSKDPALGLMILMEKLRRGTGA